MANAPLLKKLLRKVIIGDIGDRRQQDYGNLNGGLLFQRRELFVNLNYSRVGNQMVRVADITIIRQLGVGNGFNGIGLGLTDLPAANQ